MDAEDVVMWGIILFVCLLVVALVWAGVTEQSTWDQFKVEHHCAVIGQEQGGTALGIGMNGNSSVIVLPNKVTYKCDDNKTYTRTQ